MVSKEYPSLKLLQEYPQRTFNTSSVRENDLSFPTFDEALGAIALGEECSESFINIPSFKEQNTSLNPYNESFLSSSWVQIKSDLDEDLDYKEHINAENYKSFCTNSIYPNVNSFQNYTMPKNSSDVSNQENVKVDSKKDKEIDLISRVNSARRICLPKVKLNKASRSNSQPQQFLVKTGGGMGVHVPELAIDSQHFGEPSSSTSNQDSEFYCIDIPKSSSSSHSSTELSRLEDINYPDLTEFQTENVSDKKHKPKVKSLQPSQTLAISAAAIKSYFTSSTEKSIPKTNDMKTPDPEETVKSKVMGIWNNVKYSGWTMNMKTNFSKEIPINMLGKVYHHSFVDCKTQRCSDLDGFKIDFYNILWFTYRRKFPVLPASTLSTDCGWGCMIRCGQMMMAEGLKRHLLPESLDYDKADDSIFRIHKKIINLFADLPSKDAPFSIHNLVEAGHSMNKQAGDWYGPHCVAHMFKEVLQLGSKSFPSLQGLSVYVAQDGAVYIQDVLDMCSTNKCYCNLKNQIETDLDDWVISGIGLQSQNNSEINKKKLTKSKSHSLNQKTVLNNNRHSRENLVDMSKLSTRNKSSSSFDHSVGFSKDTEEKNLSEWDLLSFPIKQNVQTKNSDDDVCKCRGWKSVIIFVPVRMGGIDLNPIYNDCIYSLLMDDLCIGIIGGRPKHALYFVGFQGTFIWFISSNEKIVFFNQLFYID